MEIGSVVAKKISAKPGKKSEKVSERPLGNGKKPVFAEDADAILLDNRSGKERRTGSDRRQKDAPVAVERRQTERRAKVSRRRQIDPTTCERDYSPDEIEFMAALDDYKRRSGRMFPTCSEVLEVLKGLGYQKQPQGMPLVMGEVAGEPTPMEIAL
jgi:hypothetical protein